MRLEKPIIRSEEMQNLFLAIYFNDVEKLKNIKYKFPETFSKLKVFPLDNELTFNLVSLTFFNQKLWKSDGWIEETLPLVKKCRAKTKEMFDFWKNEFGTDFNEPKVEYNKYFEYFFCGDPNDYDEVILGSIPYFLEKGFREIDLKLYNRVECFDFESVTALLNNGAKSNIDFYSDEDSNAISRISSECSFLTTCEIIPEFKYFEEQKYDHFFYIDKMFGDLLGLIAHEKMYDLLMKYEKNNQ